MASTPSSSNESSDRTVPECHVPVKAGDLSLPSIHAHDTLAPDVSADDHVERIAQRWQDLHDEGKSASIEELCGNDYKLAGLVREFLAKVGKLEAILATQAPSADTLRGSYSKDSLLAPAQLPDELGRLGSFRILKLIGQGGMGKVYLAEDVQLKRRVAIKVLLKGGDARFLRECQTLAKVDHDHIISVYQIDEDHGTQYLVMPYLQGETLEKRLKTLMRLPLPESIRIAKQIASGLAAANKVGIIHRDIKPSNIWLEAETDRVKILDFGLARDADATNMLTQEGSVIGTPAFMAPEQAAGSPVDHRVDLFSLGCCLYQMISGVSPFARKDVLSTLRALELETPELPTVRYPETPGPLSDLAMKLLSKKPDDRPATAQAVLDALTAIEKDLSAPAGARPSWTIDAISKTSEMSPRKKSGGVGTLAAVAGVILIVGAGALWMINRGDGPKDPAIKDGIAKIDAKVDGKIDPKKIDDGPKTPGSIIELPNVNNLPEKIAKSEFKIDFRIPGAKRDRDGVMQVVEGEPMKFEIEVDQSSFVGIWYEWDDGKVQQLFPNEKDRDHYFTAGKTYTLPSNNQYTFDTVPSKKLEKFRVIATTKEWKWDPKKAHDGTFQLFANMDEFRETVRGVVIKANPNSPSKISEESVPVFVSPSKK